MSIRHDPLRVPAFCSRLSSRYRQRRSNPSSQTTRRAAALWGCHGQALQSAVQHMQQEMGMPMSGDRVVDFAQMMIRHGKDSLLRQMDRKIIDDRERESQR